MLNEISWVVTPWSESLFCRTFSSKMYRKSSFAYIDCSSSFQSSKRISRLPYSAQSVTASKHFTSNKHSEKIQKEYVHLYISLTEVMQRIKNHFYVLHNFVFRHFFLQLSFSNLKQFSYSEPDLSAVRVVSPFGAGVTSHLLKPVLYQGLQTLKLKMVCPWKSLNA